MQFTQPEEGHSPMRVKSIAVTIAAGGLLMAAPLAMAETVDYSTTGTFSLSGTNSVTFVTNGGKGYQDNIQFLGVSNVSVNAGASPIVSSLGQFLVNDLTGTEMSGSGTFTLKIDQFTPGPLNANLSPAIFSGTISRMAGGGPEMATGELVLTFAQPVITLGGIQYSIAGLGTGGLASDQLGLGLYKNAFSADLSVVPEAQLIYITAAGFALIGLVAMRRRRRFHV